MADETVLLDLNSPVFKRDLFALEKREQFALLSTLKRIRAMTWRQVYADSGLKWVRVRIRAKLGNKPKCYKTDHLQHKTQYRNWRLWTA